MVKGIPVTPPLRTIIDLSGKLRARGRNSSGIPWQIAVEQPATKEGAAAEADTSRAESETLAQETPSEETKK